MKRFNIGDKVIALTDPKNSYCQPRKKGQIYTVEAIMYCSGCGIQMVNIGVSANSENIVCRCGNKDNCNKGLQWTKSDHFTKVGDIEKEIEAAVAIEDYETADLLYKML